MKTTCAKYLIIIKSIFSKSISRHNNQINLGKSDSSEVVIRFLNSEK